jgi:hypothetical protein
MEMFKKFLAAISAAVVMGALALASPVQAALSDCTAYANVFCLWRYSQFGGSIWRQLDWQVPSTSCRPLTEPGWNDSVSSFRNNRPGVIMELYSNGSSSCVGTHLDAYYGFNYDITGNPWDEEISAISWRVGTGPRG